MSHSKSKVHEFDATYHLVKIAPPFNLASVSRMYTYQFCLKVYVTHMAIV